MIRVFFACSVSFSEVLLNQVLLQDPDLSNPLVGVLQRFRQQLVAFMSDIEKMFYQVRVSRRDADRLGLSDGLMGLQFYYMVVNLFGAVSSPSCTNYALHRTAEDDTSKFGDAMVNTIIDNFYIDNFLG